MVGTVPVWGEQVLLCKRAIEPRYGFWTLPAGFMELGETVADGALRCKPGKGGTPYYNQDLTDFAARLEFKLPAGGNNGLALRYPGTGDTAYVGMCELQVLDDNYEKVRGKIDPRQAHGSAYGMVAAARGYQHPIGEWNYEEVTVKGSTIKVELNGSVITQADTEHPVQHLDRLVVAVVQRVFRLRLRQAFRVDVFTWHHASGLRQRRQDRIKTVRDLLIRNPIAALRLLRQADTT